VPKGEKETGLGGIGGKLLRGVVPDGKGVTTKEKKKGGGGTVTRGVKTPQDSLNST